MNKKKIGAKRGGEIWGRGKRGKKAERKTTSGSGIVE
jgi:hypothetical protein